MSVAIYKSTLRTPGRSPRHFCWQFLYNSANAGGTRGELVNPLRAKLQVSRADGGHGFSRRITKRRVLTVTLRHLPPSRQPNRPVLASTPFYHAHKRDLHAMQPPHEHDQRYFSQIDAPPIAMQFDRRIKDSPESASLIFDGRFPNHFELNFFFSPTFLRVKFFADVNIELFNNCGGK